MPDCTAPSDLAASAAHAAWQASLTLGFADDAGTTRLFNNIHYGPLRVQKALYPEDAKVCLLYTSPSPRDRQKSRMPSSA